MSARSPGPGTRVGTSGWAYASWRGDFFPPGLRHRDELAHLGDRVTSLEVNATFYSLQRASSFQKWAQQVRPQVDFALKGSRYITHLLRLGKVEQALANFWASGPLLLGPRLGPVLWQLPASLEFDREGVGAFLDLLPHTTIRAAALAGRHDARVKEPVTDATGDHRIRHALEPRHPSFDTPAARRLLREHGVATVLSDGAGLLRVDADTADFRYVRLHGRPDLYRSGYAGSLDQWARRVRGWLTDHESVHVYFDNDAEGHAPHDAVALLERLSSDGRDAP
ncbi:DUF72 domain-containing protein [Knoellia koreensis]|uniref:DUF72 domain-containing protein n=1 Tax=Knoellia koreensis TaxID=2730921 RepID=A0A849HEP7_9MICO|nr:DUF72 domain-containing protein [Knoellia sp. DB2414S]